MQVKETLNEGLKRGYEVTITAKEIDGKIETRLLEVGKNLKVPGFRPGKVPLNVLRSRYEDNVLGEVIERAVNDYTNKTIQDNKLKPATQPKIEIKSFDKGKDLSYTVELEIIPSFEVQDVKKLKLEKLVSKPTDKAVDEALERVAAQHKSSEAIKGKRAAKTGDIVVIDFDGECGGERLPGMKSEDFHLELGSGSFVDNFEDQIVGKKAGDEFQVTVTFPENYGSEQLAGNKATFDVVLKEIRESKPMGIDDELAKKVGMEKLDDLKNAITEQLQSEYDRVSGMKLKRALLDTMDDQYSFEIPETMLDMEFDAIKRQAEYEKKQEEKDEKAELSEDEVAELKTIAERRVRLGLVLSEIGTEQKITVNDQDLQRAVIAEAQKYPGQEAQVFEMFTKNQQMLDNLRAPVFEEKVVEFILGEIEVKEKEVSLDELTADDEEETAKPKKKPAAKKKAVAKKDGDKKEDKPKAAKKPAAKKTTKKKEDK
jgi:trigger factor